MTATCTNCEHDISETQHFCATCGQKAHLHRLSWHDVLHDAIHYFIHADKGIFHLLRSLATKTGTVAREFVTGKRKKYFPPLNFFLLVAAIYVFAFGFNSKNAETVDILKEHPEVIKIKDDKQRNHVISIYERAAKSRAFMDKHSNLIAILALPIFSFIFWLMFKKAGYNYIEHLVANMYMSGFTLLCQVLIFFPLGLIIATQYSYYQLIIFFIFQAVYFSFFYYFFINRRTKAGALKAFLISLVSIIVWVFSTGFLIRLYVTTGFWGLMH